MPSPVLRATARAMTWLLYLGVAVTLVGLIGVILVGVRSAKIQQETDEETAKAKLQSLVALNFGSLAVSVLGLMMVVMGLLL